MAATKQKPFALTDIPPQAGRVILVTGGNSGLGKATLTTLAQTGAKLYMGARSESKAVAHPPSLACAHSC